MIVSFGDSNTKEFFESGKSKIYPKKIWIKAFRQLDYLDNAKSFSDIQKVPNSYRFHVLKGNLNNYFSYSIDMKYRIIFKYEDNNVHIVEITNHYD